MIGRFKRRLLIKFIYYYKPCLDKRTRFLNVTRFIVIHFIYDSSIFEVRIYDW